jgi:Kef-type K+ transport system membrane component KefB
VTRQVVTLIIIGLLVWGVVQVGQGPLLERQVEIPILLGFALLAAYLVGTVVERFGLPRITGYILAGILFGPYAIDLLSFSVQNRLGVFNDMALAFIGLAAGAELRLQVLRPRAKSVLFLIVCTTGAVMVGVTGVMFLLHAWFPAMAGHGTIQVVAMCALLGVVAAARSPSSAIAIISETKAKGPFTETILGVAMSMDMLILPIFSIVAALAILAFSPGQAFNVGFVLALCGELLVSVVLGVLLGIGVSAYIKYEGPQLPLVLIGLCFAVYRSSEVFGRYLARVHETGIHLEPLLICAAAGFTIQNVSRQGQKLVEALDGVGLLVFVIFFTLAGASLNMSALATGWLAATVLVGARLLMIFLGCGIATRLSRDPPEFRRYCWLGFITQAGLSIALATQLSTAFGEWGRQLGSLLIAAIALNQILGPIAFKVALERVGEARSARAVSRPEEAVKEPTS